MALYLTDLADVCRQSGYPVIEVDGWQSRARGSGGYADGKPDHVMCHHTASGPSSDGWPDVNYMTYNHTDAPLCNLYLSRDGTIYVCAGGATNTNGSGDCPHLSPDTMNTSAVGIEAGNGGTGEQWPEVQQSAYVTLCRVLCDAYRIPLDNCHGHAEYAPSRKIDMAGNSRYAAGGATWNFDAFRADIAGTSTPPPPEPKEDDMHTPASVWLGGGRLDNFVRGTDGAVWHNWYDPALGWIPWQSLGGQLASSPSATAEGFDRIDVTGQGVDGALWHIFWDGTTWSAWERVAEWP